MLLALAGAPGAAAQEAGERAFAKCYSCYSVDPDETGLLGPSLHGVVGRPAGRDAGFEYSPALAAAARQGLVWDAAALDRFVADPAGFLPGTSMAFVGIRDAAERQAVIAYLRGAGCR